tara:strand:- start:1925 stop:2260 length:336 start_codon:yes stop_codon:yes gene_type:complete
VAAEDRQGVGLLNPGEDQHGGPRAQTTRLRRDVQPAAVGQGQVDDQRIRRRLVQGVDGRGDGMPAIPFHVLVRDFEADQLRQRGVIFDDQTAHTASRVLRTAPRPPATTFR